MDFLKAAISDQKKKLKEKKKRKALEADAAADDDAVASTPGRRKFFRRGELRVDNEDTPTKTTVKSPKAPTPTPKVDDDDEDEDDEPLMPVTDVKRELRKFGLPITLFGETDKDRFKRLKNHELDKHEEYHASKGRSNLFQDLLSKDVEDDIMQATLAAQESMLGAEAVGVERAKKEAKAKKRASKFAKFKPRTEFDSTEDFILFFFKRLLRLWEAELDKRPDEVKRTMKGKVASATQKQTRQYIRPLFKLLKNGEADAGIVAHIEKICSFCMDREYVKANEEYMLLAIGNAPWPMGVTSVGIHERAGRSKIFSAEIAHVLNDENQRKYIQSTKRLMTYCQHQYPNVPSKNVA